MKVVLSLLMLVTLAKDCDNKSAESPTPDPGEQPAAVKPIDGLGFEYSAIARGTYIKITMIDKTVTVQDQLEAKPGTGTCSDDDWTQLTAAVYKLDLDQFPEWKSPTEARFYDGAATAKLIVRVGDQTYESQPFDHGTPPLELEPLVKLVLMVAENVE